MQISRPKLLNNFKIAGFLLTAFMSTALQQCCAEYHSADWALRELAGYYGRSSDIDYCGALIKDNENPDYFGENIVKAARKTGLYLNEFYLKDKARHLSKITEPFIVQLKGRYVIAISRPDRIEIKSPDSLLFLDRAEFLQLWDGSFFSVPINNMLLVRGSARSSGAEIVFVYSYHEEEFYLFREIFDELYDRAKRSSKKLIYVDELGLIPQESIEKLISQKQISEQDAFLQARVSLLRELKSIERGRGLPDPTKFYHKIYHYLANFNLQVEMEELRYENWKAIVAFDELNLNQLAVTLFCRGNIERYLDIIDQYNRGFWQYNVVIRDKFFIEQIENIARQNPDSLIFTLRGLGHFGCEESLDRNRYSVETVIIGEGDFFNLFVPDQLLQILSKNGVLLNEAVERAKYLKAFPVECIRNYYQKKMNFKISEATVKANHDITAFTETDIYRLSLDIQHAIAEGRLRSTDAVYAYVYSWVKNRKKISEYFTGNQVVSWGQDKR